MRRAFPALGLVTLALAGFGTSARAQQGFSTSTEPPPKSDEPAKKVDHPHKLCGEICDADEACVDGRCLSLCTPDCREGTYCSASSECLPLPHVERSEPTEGELLRAYGAESKDASKGALLDIGGALFLGVRPSFEWGRQHAFIARISLMNTGAGTYKVEQLNEFERVEWGVGAYFGYRRYEGDFGNLRGFFYGGGLSYHLVAVRDIDFRSVSTITQYPGFYGEFGYRWVFTDFVFGFGPSLGLRFPVAEHYTSLGPGSCVETDDCGRGNAARFEGTMVVEVGWLL